MNPFTAQTLALIHLYKTNAYALIAMAQEDTWQRAEAKRTLAIADFLATQPTLTDELVALDHILNDSHESEE